METGSENAIRSIGLPALADLMADTRQRNLSIPHLDFFAVASQFNLPWLFMACEFLRRQLQGKRIGYLGRDCYLLEQIYRTYFDSNCVYVPFSRSVVIKDLDTAVEYLKSQNCDEFVDISSTGATWEALAQKHLFNIKVLILSDVFHYTTCKPIPRLTLTWITRNSEIGPTNTVIELMNCGDSGTLINLEPIMFSDHEIERPIVVAIHKPVSDAITLESQYREIPVQLAKLTNEELAKPFTDYLLTICDQTKLLEQVPGLLRKDNQVTQAMRTINLQKTTKKDEKSMVSSDSSK